ncbi:MAG: hypothetical protein WC197_04940 [Candidatus Gastranaerophilaceae bacterium]|jgi:hypothetical protein
MYPYSQNNIPTAGVGAVNIQIYNPTVNSGGVFPNTNQGQTYSIPLQTEPVAPAPSSVQSPAHQPDTFSKSQPVAPVTNPVQPTVTQSEPKNEPVAKSPEPIKAESKKKETTQLTNDYIKTLEGYLRDPNAETRLTGAKELLKRFKEDDSRKKDPVLSSLLNLALQDPSQSVRFLALTTLNCGYAQGDKTTVGLLKQLQNSKSAYNQDADEAKEILLKMAGNKLNVMST